MTIPPGAINVVLLAGLLYAVFTDLRARRISNRLTFPLMVFGLVANSVVYGWAGAQFSLLGWLAGLAIMIVPFALGGTKAGDVKLLAAIGAVGGPVFLFHVAIYAALAGGILAIFYLIKERRVSSVLAYLSYGWIWALRGAGPKAGSIPYAPPIAAGVVLALLPFFQFAF